MQLIEMDIPMVLALNMMDEVRENGGTIQVNRLEEALEYRLFRFQRQKMKELENS